MKVACENVVRCSNYNCYHNYDGHYCSKVVVALDANGKCALARPKIKAEVKDKSVPLSQLNPPLD